MSINEPIWELGEVKLINSSGDSTLEGLWILGENKLYGEITEAEGAVFIPRIIMF